MYGCRWVESCLVTHLANLACNKVSSVGTHTTEYWEQTDEPFVRKSEAKVGRLDDAGADESGLGGGEFEAAIDATGGCTGSVVVSVIDAFAEVHETVDKAMIAEYVID